MATSRTARPTPRVVLAAALATIAAALALGLLGSAGTAHAATNALVSSDPADGATLERSPAEIELVFAQPLGPKSTVIATCGPPSGERTPFSIGAPRVADATLTVEVPNPMPRGSCAIAWQVTTATGEPDASGFLEFTITADTVTTVSPVTTAPEAAAGTGTTTPAVQDGTDDGTDDAPRVGGPLGLGRLLATLGLAVVLGSLVLIAVAWPEGVEYVLTVRFLRSAWIVGLVGAVVTVICLTAQVTGRSLGSSISPGAWVDLKDTGPGVAALVRLVATAGIGWVLRQPERVLDPADRLLSLAIPTVAVATLGFSRSGGDLVAIGVLAGTAHALAMAVWVGGLVLLWRVVLTGPGGDDLVHAVRGYGRLAVPALLVTVVSGAIQTYRLDSGELFGTGHGGVLLLKAAVVGAMVVVGLAARQFVELHLAHAEEMSAGMAGRLRRAVSAEAIAGIVVLALSAWLLSLTPGNVDAGGPSTGDYAYTERFDLAPDVRTTVSISQVVGRNGVLVDVDAPTSGITSLVIRFDPPAGTGVAAGELTVPLTGEGVAELDVADGVPITVPGTWVLTVTETTSTGTYSAQRNVSITEVAPETSPTT